MVMFQRLVVSGLKFTRIRGSVMKKIKLITVVLAVEDTDEYVDEISEMLTSKCTGFTFDSTMLDWVFVGDPEVVSVKDEFGFDDLMNLDEMQVPDCGCKFKNDDSNEVQLCDACSALPCHNKG